MIKELPPNWQAFAERTRPQWSATYWNNPPPDDADPPILGDVYELRGRGQPQRYVVVGIADQGIKPSRWSGEPQRQVLLAVTKLTGDPKKAFQLWPWHDYKSMARRTRFDLPVWAGKQAKGLYEEYVRRLTQTQGDAALPMPFQEVDILVEPPPPLPENDALPVPRDWSADSFENDLALEKGDESFYADVTIRHMADEGTVALYDRTADRKRPKDQSVYNALRRAGFVVAHREGGILRRTNSVGYPQSVLELEPGRAHALKGDLNRRGFKVAFDFSSVPLEEAKRLRVGYLRDRGERFASRADRLRTEAGSQADYARAQHEKALATIPIAGYFPTPANLAERVAALADLQSGHQVLDPSAGKGDLLRAAQVATRQRDRGMEGGGPTKSKFDAIEIAHQLQPMLKEQGFALIHDDVLDPHFDPGTRYDRILINPPYEKGASIDHVLRAWEFLRPGGRMVALLPESIWYRTDNKHTAFRDWFTSLKHRDEKQEPQPFGRSGDIATRILVLDKDRDAPTREGFSSSAEAIRKARAEVAAVASGGLRGHSERLSEGIPLGQPILRGHHSEAKHRRMIEKMQRAEEKRKELEQAAAHTQAISDHLIGAADAGGKGFAYERGLTPEQVQLERRRARAAKAEQDRTAARERKAAKTLTLFDEIVALLRKRSLVKANKVKKGFTSEVKGVASGAFGWFVDEDYIAVGGRKPGMRVLRVRFTLKGDHVEARRYYRETYDTDRSVEPTILPADITAIRAWLVENAKPANGMLVHRRYFSPGW